MRTIVALGLLTQPRKERLAVRDLVQSTSLLVEEWMNTSHAVKTILGSAVKDEIYSAGGDWCEGAPGLIGALITHLARHGELDWCL